MTCSVELNNVALNSTTAMRELSESEIALVSGAWDWGDFGEAVAQGTVIGGIAGAAGGAATGAMAAGVGAGPGALAGGVGGAVTGAVAGAGNYAWDEFFG